MAHFLVNNFDCILLPTFETSQMAAKAKRIRLNNGQSINRDEVGVRNILLRALVDTPDNFVVAVANRSF